MLDFHKRQSYTCLWLKTKRSENHDIIIGIDCPACRTFNDKTF